MEGQSQLSGRRRNFPDLFRRYLLAVGATERETFRVVSLFNEIIAYLACGLHDDGGGLIDY